MEHKIISISVEKELLAEIEKARKKHGFAGRSDFWRKAANQYLTSIEREDFKGNVRGALFIVHDAEKDDVLQKLKHARIVTTQLHNHFQKSHECLEVLIIEGKGTKVKESLEQLRRSKSVRFTQFVNA